MAELLGSFEHAVLHAVAALGGEAYGTPIRQRVSKILEREIAVGAIYSTLRRLEKKGLLSARTGEPTPVRGGRAKQYFKIEAPGILALRSSAVIAQRIWTFAPLPS